MFEFDRSILVYNIAFTEYMKLENCYLDIILKKQILIDMLFKTIDSHIHYDGYYPKD